VEVVLNCDDVSSVCWIFRCGFLGCEEEEVLVVVVPLGVACLRSLGRDFRLSMWRCRKDSAWRYIAFCNLSCVTLPPVGKSLILLAANSYLPKESRRRLRILEASDMVDEDGGESGSWRAWRSRWNVGRSFRIPVSNWRRFS